MFPTNDLEDVLSCDLAFFLFPPPGNQSPFDFDNVLHHFRPPFPQLRVPDGVSVFSSWSMSRGVSAPTWLSPTWWSEILILAGRSKLEVSLTGLRLRGDPVIGDSRHAGVPL